MKKQDNYIKLKCMIEGDHIRIMFLKTDDQITYVELGSLIKKEKDFICDPTVSGNSNRYIYHFRKKNHYLLTFESGERAPITFFDYKESTKLWSLLRHDGWLEH
jgi:hypothetical protein